MSEIYSPLSKEDIKNLSLTRFAELKPEITLKKSGVASTVLDTLSYFLEGQEQAVADISRQCFITTATGGYLDDLALDRGLSRKSAIAADGLIMFSRLSPAALDIVIPAGTKIQTNPDANGNYSVYSTDEDCTLVQNTYHVSVNATCVDLGEGGNVVGGSVASLSNGDAVFSGKVYGLSGNSFEISCTDTGSLSVSATGSLLAITVDSGVTTIDSVKSAIEADVSANSMVSLDSSGSFMPEFVPTFMTGGENGEISLLTDSVSGIDFISNTEDFTNGQKKESDLDFRERIVEGLSANFGVGTSSWYERKAFSVNDVASATIIRHTNRVARLSVGSATFSAKSYGVYGNSISIEIIDLGSTSVSVDLISSSVVNIVINIDAGVTTLDDIKNAINAHIGVRSLINIEFLEQDSGEIAVTSAETYFVDGLNGDEPPNQITMYITQNNVDGFPGAELIQSVYDVLDNDDNRLVGDYIVVRSPEPVDVTVDLEVLEYGVGYVEEDVRDSVKNALIEYASGLNSGEKLYVKSLESVAGGVLGVVDFSLTNPSANVAVDTAEKIRLQEVNCNIT